MMKNEDNLYDVLEAPPGTLLTFLNYNGYECDREYSKRAGLVEGEQYALHHVDVGSWSSTVVLVGVKGEFNSVMFKSGPYDEPWSEWHEAFVAGRGY